jgi:anti-sigma B factor antagonist
MEANMALSIQLEEQRSFTKTLRLSGRLDSETAGDLDRELDKVLASAVKVLVFDLGGLEYTTSAGLRSFLRAQKSMGQRAGQTLFVNVQASVQKVFDIVKAVDLATVFRNVRELDDYLDVMQKKAKEEPE